jgi:hypothetical protein
MGQIGNGVVVTPLSFFRQQRPFHTTGGKIS